MRQRLGLKKIKRLRKKTGLPIRSAMTRGNTDHRIDMTLDDGREFSLFNDGAVVEFTLERMDPYTLVPTPTQYD